MEKWSFNDLLFCRLSEVLDISGSEIAKRCGFAQQVFSRYTTHDVVVSVQILIKICNSLRMPSRYFISENGNHIIPERETATISSAYWQPITWDCKAVEETFGDGRIYWKDVADVMGVTSQKPHDRFLLRTRFPVDDFLITCSRLNVSPFKFLVDKNSTPGEPTGVKNGREPAGQLAVLMEKVDKLNEVIESLSGKYQALLERHNILERNVKDFFGCQSGMTADTNYLAEKD